MADTAVGFLLENLQQVIVAEADLLIGVKEKALWIETEFRVMVAYLESIDSLHQIPPKANDWVERTRSVIRRAEDLIETYAKRSSQSKTTAIYKRPIYWIEKRSLSKKLGMIKDEIIQVRQGWRSFDLGNNASDTPGFAAMATLDSALQQVHEYWLDGIKWVRDELAPLHDFLQEIDHAPVVVPLGERQKIWIKELRDIFQFVDLSFACFLDSRESSAGVENKCLSLWNSYCNEIKLRNVVSEIQGKILQLLRRYCTYGLGQILVNNGSRSLFPRIRMSVPIPDVSLKLPLIAAKQTQRRRMAYSSWLMRMPRGPIELFRAESEMMKALLEDTRRSTRDLDERAKAWLNQVQEVSVELDGLLDTEGCQDKITRKMRQIGSQIDDLAARKVTYGIVSALGDDSFKNQFYNHLFLEEIESSLLEGPVISEAALIPVPKAVLRQVQSVTKAALRRQVKSVRKEMELMQALFRDVNGMEKLDMRLKVWVEEMHGVARFANETVELDIKSLYWRFQASRRLQAIHNHILILSKWKHTYDIGDARRAGTFSHNLEETNLELDEQPFAGKYRLIRERDLIKASVMDILEIDEADNQGSAAEDILRALSCHFREMIEPDDKISKAWNELDGKTKAWVEEMVNTYEDATVDQVKDKTR